MFFNILPVLPILLSMLFTVLSSFSILCAPWADQAIPVKPDQVIPPRLYQRLFYKRVVLRPGILQQRALHGTLLIALGNIDLLHREWVQAGVIHTSRDSTGCGIKVLHLLWHTMRAFEILRQRDRIMQGTARMGRHEIGNKVLFFAQFFIDLTKTLVKTFIYSKRRFAHAGKHRV